ELLGVTERRRRVSRKVQWNENRLRRLDRRIRIILVRPNGQHGARSHAQHFLRYASQDESSNSATPMRSNNDEIDVVGSRMVHDGGPCGDVSVDGVLNRRRRIAYRILPQLLEGRQSFFFRFRSSRRTFVRLLMKNEGIKHVQRRTGAPSQIVCEREPCGRTAAEISGQQDVVEVEHPSLKVYSTRDGSVKYLYSRVLPDRTTKRPARFAPTPFPEHPYTPDDHTVDTSRMRC